MKKVAVVMAAVFALSSVAFAADVMELPAKNGKITFNHKKHQALGCKSCHADEKGGKIAGFGKDFAHKTCKGCHAAGKGPTSCKECHK